MVEKNNNKWNAIGKTIVNAGGIVVALAVLWLGFNLITNYLSENTIALQNLNGTMIEVKGTMVDVKEAINNSKDIDYAQVEALNSQAEVLMSLTGAILQLR